MGMGPALVATPHFSVAQRRDGQRRPDTRVHHVTEAWPTRSFSVES